MTTPELLVRTPDAERSLSAGRDYVVGRDPQSDIVVNDSRVSWRHAVLRVDGSTWLLEDAGSTNGTFQGSNRVQRLSISSSCAVRLGHPSDGPALSCVVSAPVAGRAPASPAAPRAQADRPPAAVLGGPARPGGYGPPAGPPPARISMERQPSAVLQLPAALLRIGRAADNQIVVADLGVSRYHAELRREPRGGYAIHDLGSHNGTFVNGQRVGSAPVTERDIISIGPATFHMVGDELQEFLDTGEISYIANDLTVTLPSGRVILDHMTFPLGERCLMGVIGPSGAGKSTLLGALTGIAPASHGTVLYDNRDLYMNYAELRNRIGLVPQENILHTQLTARRALGYAAELRFPRDTSRAERSHRIDEVLGELSLSQHANTKTAALSGGQQKRVNVALELLTKPSLLFLDEPTSGLDPGLDKSVMQQMADLAHDGRTVIVVTHSVANLNLCDRLLVIIPGGKIAYFGPPMDGLKHFNQTGWAEVFQAFESQPNRDWQAEYRNSQYFQQYIVAGMEGAAAAQQRGPRPVQAQAPKTSNRLAQMSTMVRRYMAVLASDKAFLGLLIGVIVGLGAMVRFVLPKNGFTPDPPPQINTGATSVLLILILGACFAGALNAVREIVKERPIYSRERAAGLSAGAYLCSKLIVLGVISAFQAVLLVLIGLYGVAFPPKGALLPVPLVEVMISVSLVAIASMAIGLLVSSAVSTSERAMPLVFLLVMVQVMTTGGIFAVHGKPGFEQLAWFTPSRWGFAANAATANLNVVGGFAPNNADPLWNHTPHAWLIDVSATAALFLLYSAITWWRLNKLGPLKRGA